jgi:hypothetical protein
MWQVNAMLEMHNEHMLCTYRNMEMLWVTEERSRK